MTDFLDINGIAVSVADGSFTDSPVDIGDRDRAVDGSLIQTRVTLKQKYGWTTTPMDATTAYAWKALINGYGQHWSFDSSTFSGKGLGPTGVASLYQAGVTAGKYGNCLQVGASPYGTNAVWQVQPTGLDALGGLTANNTWMGWILAQDGSTWNHYIVTDTANVKAFYKNGVLAAADADTNCVSVNAAIATINGYGYVQNSNVALPAWQATHSFAANALIQPTAGHANGRFYKCTAGGGGNSGGTEPTWPTVTGNTVTDGALTWTDQGLSSLFVDDFVLYPFPVPAAWISSLFTFCSGQAYPDIPLLYVTGLGILQNPNTGTGSPGANMIGQVGDTKLIQGVNAAVFTQNLQTIAFTLEEA